MQRLAIALVSDDTLGEYMGAAGLRMLHFARHLKSRGHEIDLYMQPARMIVAQNNEGAPSTSERNVSVDYEEFEIRAPEVFRTHRRKYDVAIAGTLSRRGLAGLTRFGRPIIHDLICPFMLENRLAYKDLNPLKQRTWEREFEADFLMLAWRANAYLVASDRQKHYWSGFLTKAGVWHSNYLDKPPIIELPNGVDMPDETSESNLPKDVTAIIGKVDSHPDRQFLVTNGGLYRWFEFEPLLEAVKILIGKGRDIGLILQGASHPDKAADAVSGSDDLRKLVRNLGIEDSVIISGWLPHRFRFEVLRRAKLGVNLHPQGLETDVSFRNRLLDFAATELPVVTSTGDIISDRMVDAGIAIPLIGLEANNIAFVIGRALDAHWGKNYHLACAGFRAQWDWSNCVSSLDDAIELAMETPAPLECLSGPPINGILDRMYNLGRKTAKWILRR